MVDASPGLGALADNIVHFARVLRRAGVPVGPAAVVDAVRAVEIAGMATRDDFYWTLHAIFATRREHHVVFDEAFRLFWHRRRRLARTLAETVDDDEGASPAPTKPASRRVAEAFLGGHDDPRDGRPQGAEVVARLAVSGEEVFRRRDFAAMTAEEAAEAAREIERLRLPDDQVRARRLVAARTAGTIDMRRTLRTSLRTGGKMILLRHRRPAQVHPPIVALCDVSGSMSEYTRLLLHFMHALGRSRRVHSFLFGTRLTNVTRSLRRKDPDEALAACAAAVSDWSGGTRIGSALHEFNRVWSRRVLGQGAVVLLITDGLERDGGADLASAMERLHRSCRRLIWLNPLLRFEGFAPRAAGIRAMLPHVDEFRPVHSLEAVADLCRALSGDGGAAADPRRWLKAAA